MFCVRFSSNVVVAFRTAKQRHQWFINNGFFQASGIWKHLDGRYAGTFEKGNIASSRKNCLIPIGHKSMWEFLRN